MGYRGYKTDRLMTMNEHTKGATNIEAVGTHEVLSAEILKDISIEEYEIKHKGSKFSRELEYYVLGRNIIAGNKLSVRVDINSNSRVSINPEGMSEIGVDIDHEAKTALLELDKGVLTVESLQVPGSFDHHVENEGLVTTAIGLIDQIHDGEGKKTLEGATNDLINLAELYNLKYADDKAGDVIESSLPQVDERIKDVVITELQLKGKDYEVEINWTEDGEVEVKNQDEHAKQMEELGGDIDSVGSITELDKSGGKR